MRSSYFLVLIALGLLSNVKGQSQGDLLIKNGTLLTITQGILENTDVLIIDGKISRIERNVSPPKEVPVIDATGIFVMPGIVDAHSHIAIDVVNEKMRTVTSDVFIGDAINPYDINIYRALSGGVTTAHVLHGSANPIGGENEIIKLRYGLLDPQQLKMEGAPRTIKFALGENPIRTHGAKHNAMPRTRMGVEFVIRNALKEAQDYNKEWAAFNKRKDKKGFKGTPPTYNARKETLVDVLTGKVIIHCHSYRADEIFMLMEVCKEFGIKKVVFQHANEGFKIAPELAKFGAMASVFPDWWSYKFEVYYSTAYNAAILTRNGVLTSINSDHPEEMRHLFLEAAKSIKYGGLTEDEALSLITINPAIQLGIENRVGSLEVGKDGDVALFEGHPLSIYTKPRMTIVEGVVRFDAQKDPDDMRLLVDPTLSIEGAYNYSDHHEDGCMKGASE